MSKNLDLYSMDIWRDLFLGLYLNDNTDPRELSRCAQLADEGMKLFQERKETNFFDKKEVEVQQIGFIKGVKL